MLIKYGWQYKDNTIKIVVSLYFYKIEFRE